MNLRHLVTAASLALLPLAAGAATLVVPAAGTGPGANASQWQSELTLHNTGSQEIAVTITFHQSDSVSGPVIVRIAGRSTRSLADVVRNEFGKDAATGALVVEVADAAANRLAVSSRTFNVSADGEFGQDIPAVNVSEASAAGDVTVLAAPSSAHAYRFNFGLYAVSDTTVRWELIRADGSLASTQSAAYRGGTQLQYNNGVAALFGSEARNNDSIHAVVVSGKAIFYGSAVNQNTGDPTFVPGIRTREDIRINFAGIDLDENGTVDLRDADRDGVIDTPLDVTTSMFPNFFRVVATGENGEPVTFEIVSSPADTLLVDENGTIELAATGNLKGSHGEIRVRATAGGSATVLVIPVNFR